MSKLAIAIFGIALLALFVIHERRTNQADKPLPLQPNFNVTAYMGHWYSIAALPNLIE